MLGHGPEKGADNDVFARARRARGTGHGARSKRLTATTMEDGSLVLTL